ncbi:MAG TPA: 3-isopropylmalate dehydrogenase, partial [Pseudolabrys sp.]
AIDATGSALPAATLELAQRSDAILLGAVGGPKWPADAAVRPEQGLLQLRQALGLFANLRPVIPHPAVLDASPIKAELLRGVDIMVVRELTGGIYFGAKTRTATEAVDVCRYTVEEIERVVRLAAGLARARRRKLTSIDKANVLETSRLWRSVVERIMPAEFPEVGFEHMLVDAAAMHLLRRPRDFDVIVTENMFGDILTDEASMLAGSLGLLPSASLGAGVRGGLFEPIHGSAPDIAGRGIANPYAAILSAALLLRYALQLASEARALESAVSRAIESGARPADLAAPGKGITTRAAADAVLALL